MSTLTLNWKWATASYTYCANLHTTTDNCCVNELVSWHLITIFTYVFTLLTILILTQLFWMTQSFLQRTVRWTFFTTRFRKHSICACKITNSQQVPLRSLFYTVIYILLSSYIKLYINKFVCTTYRRRVEKIAKNTCYMSTISNPRETKNEVSVLPIEQRSISVIGRVLS